MQQTNLTARLHVLETSCRRQALFNRVLLVLLVCMVVCAFGLPAPDEVRATAFVLQDAGGTPRARLAIRQGHPSLVFIDSEGKTQAGLGLSAGDETDVATPGQPLLFLGHLPNPGLLAYSSASPESSALMLMTRSEPLNVASVQVSERGSSVTMATIGEGGPWGVTPRATLTAPRGAASELQLRDSGGELVFSSSGTTEFDGSNFFAVRSARDLDALARIRPTPPLVEVVGDQVDDDLLQALSKLDGIRRLSVRAAPVPGPDGLAHIAGMSSLIELHIVNSKKLGKAGYAALEESAIRNLGLVMMPVDETLIDVLSTMPDLESLVLRSEGLTTDLVERLTRALPHVEIVATPR